jgi:hypothetical protein
MTKRKPPSRAARLKKARAEAAAALGLPDSDLHVKRYALLAVEYDNLTARYLSGDRLDVSELTRLEGSMQEIRATLPPPTQQVELVIVSRKEVQECPLCKHSFAVQKAGESLEERQAKARLEQSSPASPPASENKAKNNNHQPAASPSPRNKVAKPEVRPYHETMQRDSRPGTPINGGGSLVWHTGARNGGSAW